ncbi:unnamed protein product [Blumeria hordei]|uniref:Uncharacterized protein n=1 Tax=Blumeria hordei TaxID=2867405 RepID=A0A383UP92_BLUHO|nr:unnamed protein product [Blumeria hordei]
MILCKRPGVRGQRGCLLLTFYFPGRVEGSWMGQGAYLVNDRCTVCRVSALMIPSSITWDCELNRNRGQRTRPDDRGQYVSTARPLNPPAEIRQCGLDINQDAPSFLSHAPTHHLTFSALLVTFNSNSIGLVGKLQGNIHHEVPLYKWHGFHPQSLWLGHVNALGPRSPPGT